MRMDDIASTNKTEFTIDEYYELHLFSIERRKKDRYVHVRL